MARRLNLSITLHVFIAHHPGCSAIEPGAQSFYGDRSYSRRFGQDTLRVVFLLFVVLMCAFVRELV